jgi:hypothetical protein
MAHAPSSNLCPVGAYRVVRIHKMVTEAYITASSPAAAAALGPSLAPDQWISRKVLQTQPSLEDEFEYDAISSDIATPVPIG